MTEPTVAGSAPATLTSAQGVRLVAERDLRARLRTKAYKVSTVLTALLVVAVIVLPRLLEDDAEPNRDVALVGATDDTVRAAVTQAVTADGARVTFVVLPDQAAAEAAVRAGDVDAAVIDGREVVTLKDQQPGGWQAAAADAVGRLAALEGAGLSPQESADVLSQPVPPVRALEPRSDEQDSRTGIAFVGALLLYSFLSLYGAWVLYGVAEEKSSRVAEVLLSAVRPTTLLAGKVIGIGLAALLQGLITMDAALVATVATGSALLDAVSLADLFGLLGWFLLGYAFYAVLYAAAGSLVARQEDVQNVATPPALPLLAGYIVAAQAAFSGEDNVLVRFMSLFPPTAPVVMPVRATVSDVPAWEVALSVVLTVAGIVLLVRVAGRVYASSLLRTGGRVRWRDALRSAPA